MIKNLSLSTSLNCLLTIPNTLFAWDAASAHCLEILKSAVVNLLVYRDPFPLQFLEVSSLYYPA